MTDPGLIEETDGWRDLQAWLKSEPTPGEAKRTTSRIARELDISQPAVRGWVVRHSRPTIGPLRDALCRLIGSRPERWATNAERDLDRKFPEERTGDHA